MNKKKNAQKRLVNELKNQLMIQAERLGIEDEYNPLCLEEMKLDSVKKIMTEFYMERSNLEYELNIMGSKKKEILIKLERLNSYIRKAVGLHAKHLSTFETLIEKATGDRKLTQKAVSRINPVRVKAAA
ncbi:MAG: hypothetical protein PHH60_00515 [Candidatus Margulisbacteria bacterium]|nr:hypothetical protein [Candidatus Margulisiibacteriota bacterium]